MAKYGKRGGFMPQGGGNMNSLMKQAQKMQEQLLKAQEEVAAAEVEGSSGGGMVTVKMDGGHKLKSVSIKPEAIDPEDPEMLEDLVLAAVNHAVEQVEALSQAKMGSFGSVPGLF